MTIVPLPATGGDASVGVTPAAAVDGCESTYYPLEAEAGWAGVCLTSAVP